MKKIYLVFSCILITVSLFGQPVKTRSKLINPLFKMEPDVRNAHDSFSGKQMFSADLLKNASADMQRLDSLSVLQWDEINGQWQDSYTSYYFYNESNLFSEFINYSWDESSETWIADDRETSEYDENGNRITLIDYQYNDSAGEWYGEFKLEYFYDENDLLTEIIESWNDELEEAWYLVLKTVYSFNEQGRLDSTLEYFHSTDWQESWKTEYEYDENGNLTNFREFDKSETEPGGWINSWEETYEYNENNNLVFYNEHEWNESENRWNNSDREEYTYTSNNVLAAYFDYDWIESENDWVMTWKEEYEYNTDYPFEQLILPAFFIDETPNFFEYMLLSYQSFNYVENEWQAEEKGNFYYKLVAPVSTVSEPEIAGISFYPNPAKSEITFRLKNDSQPYELKMYDLTGKVVLAQTLFNDYPISISSLKNGMYLFRILDSKNDLIYSNKIVINH